MNRSRLFCVLMALFSLSAQADVNDDALAVIKKSADAVFKSETFYFERVSASPKVKGKSMGFKDRYYLQNNPDGTFNAFFQQTLFTSNVIVTNIDTMYLKNAEGLWELYPSLAINISSFAKDAPAVDPFRILRAVTAEHYKLELKETESNQQHYYVVTGKSLTPDEDRKVSITNAFIPVEFKVVINKATFLPHELSEEMQNGMKIEKKLDKVEVNQKFDAGIFDVGGREKAVSPGSMSEYVELKKKGMAQRLSYLKDVRPASGAAPKKGVIIAFIIACAIPVVLLMFRARKTA